MKRELLVAVLVVGCGGQLKQPATLEPVLPIVDQRKLQAAPSVSSVAIANAVDTGIYKVVWRWHRTPETEGDGTGSVSMALYIDGSVVVTQSEPLAGRKLSDVRFSTPMFRQQFVNRHLLAEAKMPNGVVNRMGEPIVIFPDEEQLVTGVVRHRGVAHP